MHRIWYIRIRLAVVWSFLKPYNSQTYPNIPNAMQNLQKVAPDDGLIQSETCRASNEKITFNHSNLCILLVYIHSVQVVYVFNRNVSFEMFHLISRPKSLLSFWGFLLTFRLSHGFYRWWCRDLNFNYCLEQGGFTLEYPLMCSQPYGAMRTVACEELEGCAMHCGWYWRVKEFEDHSDR